MKLLLLPFALFALTCCSEPQTEDQPEAPLPPSSTEPEEKTVGDKISEGGAKAADKLGEVVDKGVENSEEAAEKAKKGILEGVDKLGDKMREGADKIDRLTEDAEDTSSGG